MISIIIPYMANEAFKDVIQPSIDSLLSNSPKDSEFILISINPSNNEDYALFEKFKIIEARSPNKSNIIHSGHFTWALNIGIKEARFPFVCTTGIDMLYPPNFKDIIKILSKKPVAILKKQVNNERMLSYAHVGFLKKDALAIGGFDERMLGGWATDLDFWSRLIKKTRGIITGTIAKDDITEIVLTHMKHPIIHKKNRRFQMLLNTILCKTNPIKIGIDEEIGDIEDPPQMLPNLIDLEGEIPYLIKYTAPHEHRCLVVGYGFSPLAKWLSDFRDCDVIVTDNTPDKELESDVEYENIDLRSIPFENNSFDRIYCINKFKHLPRSDVKIVVSEFARVCKGLIGISLDFRFTRNGSGFNEQDIQNHIITDEIISIYPLDFTCREMLKVPKLAVFVLVNKPSINKL